MRRAHLFSPRTKAEMKLALDIERILKPLKKSIPPIFLSGIWYLKEERLVTEPLRPSLDLLVRSLPFPTFRANSLSCN